ncbi:MAG: hypothetical protein P9M15_04245, partial [Candidatus Electryoneaceae bacterium]|nr:hypothetical protein [Candidatus Electryoneaceae bacterium]
LLLQPLADAAGREVSELVELMEKGRGNWGNLYRFLTGSYPTSQATPPDDIPVRLILLETLTDKELRASSVNILEHHFYYTTLDHPLSDPEARAFIAGMDSTDRERYQDYVIAPRIDYEPSWGWRRTLCELFIEHPELRSSKNDKKLLKWLRRNIVVEEEYNRLGAVPTPDRTLQLMRAAGRNVARLYIGLCRVRGLPARFNPVSSELERWDEDHWQEVIISPKKSKKKSSRKGTFVLEADSSDTTAQEALYLKTWAVSRWATDLADAVDFGYEKPYKDITWPQQLPPGLYFLTTGFRREDGSAPVAMTWFEIKSSRETRIQLNFRSLDDEER